MSNSRLSDVHQRIKANKAKRQDLKTIVKDELASNGRYKAVLDQLEELKAKKAQIETETKSRLQHELQEIEKLNNEIKNDQQVMSDIAISTFMKGEKVELKDESNTEYEPVIKVTFKKK